MTWTSFQLPGDRTDLVRTTWALYQLYGNDNRELVDASRALAFFLSLLLALEPTIMRINGWLFIDCGHPIQWIRTDPIRLVAIDVLQSLLESRLDEYIVERCTRFEYTWSVLCSLVDLRASSTPIYTEKIPFGSFPRQMGCT